MNTPTYLFALREDIKDLKEFLPTRAEPEATGYDVRAAFPDQKSLTLKAGDYFKIPLGFRGYCPPGWYYQLHPRSSSFIKKEMHSLIGIIDETFPLEAHFCGRYMPASSDKDLTINFGDPIAQIIPQQRIDAKMSLISNEDFNMRDKSRNAARKGGFGSTT